MRTRRMKTLAILGGLALATASQVIAQDVYVQRSRPGFGMSVEFREARRQRLMVVAHDIDNISGRISWQVSRVRYGYNRWQMQAQRRISDLAEAADHFHDQVERRRADFGHTIGDYRELQRAFDRAERAFNNLHPSWRLRRDFNILSARMDELDDLFGNRWERGRHYDSYDRFDRRNRDYNRYDDDDDD